MNKIKVFKNPEFGSIRIVEDGEKCLFCVKDHRNNNHLETCMPVTPAGKQHFLQIRDLILLTI